MRVSRILLSVFVLSVCLLVVTINAQQPGSLSAQAKAGKRMFVQRCSVCHLPPLGPGAGNSYARSLTGYIKSGESEARAREVISKGIPGMPGFQYIFEPGEIENIIAYINTLK